MVVGAASSLRFAFRDIAPAFERRAGARVTLIFGSSGSLTAQIEQGAPIDILFAANEAFIDRLRDQARIVPRTQQVYALGRIALAVNHRNGRKSPELPTLLQPDVRRIAIANPAHAPYGLAAKQALQRAGLWDQIQPKLVLAENVEQTAQFLRTGNAEAAIIAWSVADSPRDRVPAHREYAPSAPTPRRGGCRGQSAAGPGPAVSAFRPGSRGPEHNWRTRVCPGGRGLA